MCVLGEGGGAWSESPNESIDPLGLVGQAIDKVKVPRTTGTSMHP